ncbi:hypothetical protein ILUMI_21026 [Ignelater luminosus]|uniref:MD-2-related lipid-recognition domain-containing protein n=1 Tax=Ignelater luminosus TaxID=2038154 RepID=A0A8K0FYD0_IGNLU|nr:hypothetical protein ILUMI_21026 [Ignelater luminosus]
MIFEVILDLLTVYLVFPSLILSQSHTNFVIKRFEVCNHTQRAIKLYANITEKNGIQYIDSTIISPYPWDDNLGALALIDSAPTGKRYINLFQIREKNICKAASMYLSEFWYEIVRRSGLQPGVCPIPAGRLHCDHAALHFNRMALQTFPFGDLRFTINTVDNRNPKNILMCFLMEVENFSQKP